MPTLYYVSIWLLAIALAAYLIVPDQFRRTIEAARSKLKLLKPSLRGVIGECWKRLRDPQYPYEPDARRMDARIAIAASAVIVACLLHYFGRVEFQQRHIATFVFTVSSTCIIGAVVAFLSKRLLFTTAATALLVATITVISVVKFKLMHISLHAYDVFFYAASLSTLNFLWNDYRAYLLTAAAALCLAVLVLAIIWRLDKSRVSRLTAVATLGSAIVATGVATALGGKPRSFLVFSPSHRYVALFYSSSSDAVRALVRGQIGIFETAKASSGPPIAHAPECKIHGRVPNIILIQQESAVPPSLFPGLQYDKRLDPFFESEDGKLHKLRVETYGGSSWLTEFSVLAGLSTYSFGSMRHFVQPFMKGRLKETVPQILMNCGYRNVLFYPALKNFVVNEKFYDSIGLKEVYDKEGQGATDYYMRDRFWYGNALRHMEKRFQVSDEPQFTFIQTMSPHGPHNWKFAPEIEAPGGGDTPEMNEYLRRLWIAKIDLDYFFQELRRRFPQRSFLVVHYGDHHPLTTRPLIGLKSALRPDQVLDTVLDTVLDPDSIGSITYFSARGINYQVPPLPETSPIDAPYLGLVLLRLAGLPLPPSYAERERLMALCKGRYHSCGAREEILRFHRRLTDAGLVTP